MQVEPAQPQVDAAGMDGGDRAELLGQLQGRVSGSSTAPTRIVEVTAAITAASTGVDDDATPVTRWCSATRYRR